MPKTINKNGESNQLIDLFKLFFAICVVAIHTGLLWSVKYGYMLKTNIYRLAVPFFFLCSGYYLEDKILKFKSDLPEYIKKNFLKYVFWCIAYAIIYQILLVSPFDWNLFLTDIMNTFYFTTTTVFWFLGVLIIFAIILLHVKDSKKINIIFLLSTLFYLIGLSFTTYKYLFENTSFQVFTNFFINNYHHNRYFLFTLIFPFLGYYIRKLELPKKMKLWQVVCLLFVSYGLLILETYLYYDKTFTNNEYDYFLMMPVVISFLLILLNKINIKTNFNTKILRNLSISIYFYHFAIIWTYYRFKAQFPNCVIVDLCNKHTSIYFLVILAATLIFTLIVNLIKVIIKKIKKSLNLKCFN